MEHTGSISEKTVFVYIVNKFALQCILLTGVKYEYYTTSKCRSLRIRIYKKVGKPAKYKNIWYENHGFSYPSIILFGGFRLIEYL